MAEGQKHYRMIVTDIDGTLVDAQQEISERNKRTIQAFQRQGGIVTLATGRVEEAAYRFVQELEIQHPVILYNGGKIVDFTTEECHYEAVLATDVVHAALRLLERQPFTMIFYADKKVWVQEITPVIQAYMKKDRIQCLPWKSTEHLLQAKVNKILIIQEDQDFSAIVEAIQPFTGLQCEWVISEVTYLEILPHTVSKGQALRLLADRMGVELGDIIAIGDNLNDLEMLREAGLGVAVDNAHPLLKEHAQYTAPSNLDDAIADVIEKYCLRG